MTNDKTIYECPKNHHFVAFSGDDERIPSVVDCPVNCTPRGSSHAGPCGQPAHRIGPAPDSADATFVIANGKIKLGL